MTLVHLEDVKYMENNDIISKALMEFVEMCDFENMTFNDLREEFKDVREDHRLLMESATSQVKENKEVTRLFNGKELQKEINEEARRIFGQIKFLKLNENNIKNFSNEITKSVNALYDKNVGSIQRNFVSIYNDGKFSKKDIINSIGLCYVVLVVNSLLAAILALFLTPTISMLVTSSIVAPITEEFAKQYSIKFKFGNTFIAVFNLFETGLYFFQISKMLGKKVSVKTLFKLRTPAIIMHFVTYAIHKLKFNKLTDKQNRILTFVVSAGIHSAFNYTVSTNKSIQDWYHKGTEFETVNNTPQIKSDDELKLRWERTARQFGIETE